MEAIMKKKKKCLRCGQYRVQRRYTGEDGKSHLKSFTARTLTEANALADEWMNHREESFGRLTVRDAVEKYINSREAVLSPATVRGYRSLLKNHISGPIGYRQVADVTSLDLQIWVSDLSVKMKPKSVRNTFILLESSLKFFVPKLDTDVRLPARRKPDLYCPSDEDIRILLENVHSEQLRAAVLLASIGTLRRSEACGLMRSDIHGDSIHVHRAMVLDSNGQWVIKEIPKTYESNRTIPMPSHVMKELRTLPKTEDDRLLSITPSQVTDGFVLANKRSGLPHFRFHDLRHFSVSYLHAKGIPDKYLQARGGWSDGSSVMKRIYQNVIDLEKVKQDRSIIKAFSDSHVI